MTTPEQLRRLAGQDFGYNLARWHRWLLRGKDEWGYRHPYAWRRFRPAIEKAVKDADRLRLVAMLEVRAGATLNPPHRCLSTRQRSATCEKTGRTPMTCC